MYVQKVLDQFELKVIQILLRPEKKMYSRMADGRNDNYVQRTFTSDAFRKRRKRENSTVAPKLTFLPQQKNDTNAQLYCTLSTYITPKTISRQNQKNPTQNHNCMEL